GEDAPPPGLVEALALGNRAQDVLMSEYATGRTGNEILDRSKERLASERIDATIYTHAIGYHGHAAGPTIGLWDQQQGVPGAGDHPVFPDTAYSIELSIETPIAEWSGQPVRIMLEEDAFFDGERCTFLDGRQTEFWMVG
ncbi:MAG: Xaa-Pro aminopeptidase, partial [Acidimicrobiia bacterium]|nr:Xaa-Pro aminopeptidase [Acidimicrobiia bacterium]